MVAQGEMNTTLVMMTWGYLLMRDIGEAGIPGAEVIIDGMDCIDGDGVGGRF